MRALFVLTALPPEPMGGAETYALQLAARLVARGMRVTILGRDSTLAGIQRRTSWHDAVEVVQLSAPLHAYFAYLPHMCWWLRRNARLFDVIQFFDFDVANGLGLLATRASRVPRILRDEQQLAFSLDRLSYTNAPLLPWLTQRGWATADWVVHVSTCEARVLVAAGYPPHRVTYLFNGIDSLRYPVAPPEYAPVILCPARLRPEKNHMGLLNVFAKILAEVPEAQLVLAGDGPMEGAVARRVGELSIGASVQILGRVEDMASAYAQARVCVLLSLAEGPALTVLEGQCCGRPAVVYATGGLTDSVVDGVTGFIVPQGDEVGAVQRITKLLRDDKLMLRMGEQAASFVRRERSIDVAADAYYEYLTAATGLG